MQKTAFVYAAESINEYSFIRKVVYAIDLQLTSLATRSTITSPSKMHSQDGPKTTFPHPK
jgi:hypothetical protein